MSIGVKKLIRDNKNLLERYNTEALMAEEELQLERAIEDGHVKFKDLKDLQSLDIKLDK